MAYQQVTLATCQARLRDRVESVPWWTPAEATSAINEALRLWNAMVGFWQGVYTTVAVPFDPFVALPSTLVKSARVLWNGLPLEPASSADLDYGFPNWRGSIAGTGNGIPARPSYWAPFSLTLLAIYPADPFPAPGGSLNSLMVEGVRQTPILVNPTDYIDIGQEALSTLLGYAQHVLAFKVGGSTLVASYPGWLAFLKAGAAENRQFAASAYYRLAAGADQTRRLLPPSIQAPSLVEDVAEQVAKQ